MDECALFICSQLKNFRKQFLARLHCALIQERSSAFHWQKPHHLSNPVAVSWTASTISGLVGRGAVHLRQRSSTVQEIKVCCQEPVPVSRRNKENKQITSDLIVARYHS
jgi:hypothetical protein